ncbi:MAG: SRPBCC domain-containing protein [Streptosporangiales bacterium]|nr:SRPBCC domain-containing protein [Streptosporangiales bacterium]MBO0890609.1 SRPBCC domain-containing protein [Acidothermales bacterium]
MRGHVATARTEVTAPPARVWAALTDPELVAAYMFGTRIETDWKEGGRIVWKGEYQGRSYEDHGTVLEVEPERRLSVTHFSPLTGQDDVPENYHTVTYELSERDGGTLVTLTQDNAGSEEEAEHSARNWEQMLAGMKRVAEQG